MTVRRDHLAAVQACHAPDQNPGRGFRTFSLRTSYLS